jgi:hypothetical protein
VRSHGVDPQQMFVTTTLMCVVWLAALTMLVRQAQFTDWPGNRAPLTSGYSLVSLPSFQR